MTTSEENKLYFRLKPDYHQIAQDFAKQQSTVEKGKKVYLNTLAVCTVNTFLEEISFETFIDKSYSWNPIIRCFEDVADLVVVDIGRVECLSLIEEDSTVAVPKGVKQGRVAYIVVKFGEVLNEVQLLGFYPCPDCQIAIESLDVSQLEPMNSLIDYLFTLELQLERDRKLIDIGVDLLNSGSDLAVELKRIAEKIKVELTSQNYEEIISRFLKLSRENIKSSNIPARGKDILSEIMGLNNAYFASVRGSTNRRRAENKKSDSGKEPDLGKELFGLADDLYDELEELWEDEL